MLVLFKKECVCPSHSLSIMLNVFEYKKGTSQVEEDKTLCEDRCNGKVNAYLLKILLEIISMQQR